MFCSFDALQSAILAGDHETAQYFAEQLARLPQHPVRQSTGELVSIKVRVADQCNTGPALPLTITASYTVYDLKMRMQVEYNFAVDKQICIVNGKALGDFDLVCSADCHYSPPEVCVYLKSGRISQPVDAPDETWRTMLDQPVPVRAATTDVLRQPARASTAFVHHAPGDLTLGESDFSPRASLVPNFNTGHSSGSSGYSSGSSALETNDWELLPNVSAVQVTTTQRDTDVESSDDQLPTMMGVVHHTLTDSEVTIITDNRPTSRAQAWHADTEAAAGPQLQQQQQSHGEQESLAEVQLCAWSCPECTYDNEITRPGCEMCGTARPEQYYVDPQLYVPQSESERERLERERIHEQLSVQEHNRYAEQLNENYLAMASVEQTAGLVTNSAPFQCPICMSDIGAGEGVVLRECLHEFCRSCLEDHVSYSTEPAIICPYMDNTYSCSAPIPDREVKALAPQHYETYLQRSLATAEAQEHNSFHCRTPDCAGWCVYDDNVNFFKCPICCRSNCLTCKAIHEGMDCKQYQDDLKVRAANDVAARQTQMWLEKLIATKRAMKCPGCQIVLQKKDGCDWIKCSVCKLEVCWVRKMARWGPKGTGDTTAGCRCNLSGRKCHPKCRNCH